MEHFPNGLRPLRVSRGMRQADVANYLGIPRRTYAKYENSLSIPIPVLSDLAALYAVSFDELIAPSSMVSGIKRVRPRGSAAQ